MKKQTFLLWATLVFFVLAAEAFAAVEDVDCEQYYKFQNGIKFEDFRAEKISYAPGDEVILSYNLVSMMDIPVVEGRIRVQVLFVDEKQGEEIIDEFFAFENLALMPKDISAQEVKWKVPAGAKSGTYEAKLYFLVKEFNLAGLSFVPYGPPGIPGALTSFDVESSSESRIYFSKLDTKINDEEYPFTGFLLSSDSKQLKIETHLLNEGEPKEVNLKLLTYKWDDLDETPMQEYTVEQKISLLTNGKGTITYQLPALTPGTYEIKFLAVSGEEKAILKMRVPITGAKGRFIYSAIDKFPLKESEKTKIFMCLSNSADYVTTFNGTINVQVSDADDKIIFSETTPVFEVIPKPMGKLIEFTPEKSYTVLKLKATLLDENDKIHDEVSLSYDYGKFSNVPKKIALSLEKESFKPTEKVKYTITYTDNENREVDGRFLIYLLNSKGNILQMVEKEFIGSFSGEFGSLELGVYKISARELDSDVKAEEDFEVSYKEVVTTPQKTTQEITTTTIPAEKSELVNYLLWAVVIVAILYLIVFFLKRGGKAK